MDTVVTNIIVKKQKKSNFNFKISTFSVNMSRNRGRAVAQSSIPTGHAEGPGF